MLADDFWSPGSGGPVWARITRLQSVDLKSRVRSPFVSECCLSDDPVERLAAIAWIGRTRSEKHVPDLELRLADKFKEVRQLAFEALQILDDPHAKKLVLQTMQEVDDFSNEALKLPSYRRSESSMGAANHDESALSDLLKGLSLKKRKEWIEKCVDQPQWLLEKPRESKDVKYDFHVVLKQSVLNRDESLTVSVDSLPPESRAAEEYKSVRIDRVRDLKCIKHRLSRSFWDSGELLRTKMKDGDWNYDVGANFQSVVPGVYAFAFRSPHSSMGTYNFPFFIRINRSQKDEQAIPALISQLPNVAAARELGELRSREAVPKLIEYFRNSAECEHGGVGISLGIIGDGRAAEAFLDLPSIHCQDSDGNTGDWINELDSSAQVALSQRLNEISAFTKSWDSMNNWERSNGLLCYSLALAYSDRPLTVNQTEVTELLIDKVALHYTVDVSAFQIVDLMTAYARGDPLILQRMLKKIEISPILYLHAVQGVTFHHRFENELSMDCRIAVRDALVDLVSSANLNSELQDFATRLLKRVEIDIRVSVESSNFPSVARFGRQYYMDNRRGLWCKDKASSNLWCTFCRPIASWSVVDADIICVAMSDGSIQVVRGGKSIKSWDSTDLWKSFDERSLKVLLRGPRIGKANSELVVSTYGSLVMILPLSENGAPWFVGVPAIRETLPPDAYDEENPFQQQADNTPTLNQRVEGGYNQVWSKGDTILVQNRGRYSYAIQCVNLITRKVVWEKQRTELDLPKLIETEGWIELTK